MRFSRLVCCTLGITAVAAVTAPLANGQTGGYRQAESAQTSNVRDSQNFSQSEFFSQAERDLIARVQDHLRVDPALAPMAKTLTIDAEVGTITLSGAVPTTADKERLVRTVERVLGVEQVNDRIRVSDTAALSSSRTTAATTVRANGESNLTAQTSRSIPPARTTERSAVASLPATGSRGARALDDPALPGSGQMSEEDRTGSTGPSGSRSFSALGSGAVDTIGRVAKPAGDYAVTSVDRGLASQIRLALNGHPDLPVTEENVHLVVDNGFVTLQGWVPSERDRVAIADHVKDIAGVQGLNNQLAVRTSTAR